MPTVLNEQTKTECPSGRAEGQNLWLSSADAEAATGWSLKPEGLCKGAICVPVPPARRADLVSGSEINVTGFWRHMGHPVAHDAAGETWVLGANAAARSSMLTSLEAPDFELPDLAGRMHSLAEQRGKKVLLATWASW